MTTPPPDLDAMMRADEIRVSKKKHGKFWGIGAVIFLVSAVIVGSVFVMPSRKPELNMTAEEEEFRTDAFQAPVKELNDTQPVPRNDNALIELPVPADNVPVDVPPPPPPAPISPAVPQTTSAEAASIEPQDGLPMRYKSKLMELDGTMSTPENDRSRNDKIQNLTVAGNDLYSKFLSAHSMMGDRSAKANQIQRIDALVPEGTLIPGILETAIISDLPGQIRAITSQDVYSFDGRRILIPTGTRLIGEYQSEIMNGQTRVFIVWTRLIRNDGVSVRLDSIGTDSLGRSGLTGRVDNKWLTRFGSAMMLSVVGAGRQYMRGKSAGHFNEASEARRNEDLVRESLSKGASDMADQALSRNLFIPPTISIDQGERIFVYVREDLDFSDIYPDPVAEALQQIKREHQRK